MFWWRKRNEGFEWREYVRTTILVRREQRRQRIKDAQDAAVAQVKNAGRRGVEAGVHGARAAGQGAWSGIKTGSVAVFRGGFAGASWLASCLWAAATGVWAVLTDLTGRAGWPVAERLEPLLTVVRTSRLATVLQVVGSLAALGAVYRWYFFGLDADVYVASAVAVLTGVVVLLAIVTDPERASQPRAARRDGLLSRLKGGDFELPAARGFWIPHAGKVLAAVVATIVLGTGVYFGAPMVAGWVASSDDAQPTERAEVAATSWDLEGRATVVSGDRLRVAGRSVVLDGIEAPETGQSCQRKSGRWRCGASAKDALGALVRGRRVTCEVLGEDDDGSSRARCSSRGQDIAEQLVREGHVFAVGGFLSRYASLEAEAQDAQKGLWAGAVERPQDYRDKRWEEAKKSAPDGCPIKGRVRSGARTYVLPWAPSYDSIRLSTARGERWFCSESEAQEAGWSRGSAS